MFTVSGRNSPESLIEDPAFSAKFTALNPSPYYYADLQRTKDDKFQTTSSALPNLNNNHYQNTSSKGIRYKQNNTLDFPPVQKKKLYSQKRYSVVEEGVHIIKCQTPSTTTSDDSNCTECRKRREGNFKAFALERRYLDDEDDNDNGAQEQQSEIGFHHQMPPLRLLEPALCACTGSSSATVHADDEFNDIFRPRSIFYVHDPNEQSCADCCGDIGGAGESLTGSVAANSNNKLSEYEMKNGRLCKFYETAFDSKIGRSDDDGLDELSRINSRELLSEIPPSGISSSKQQQHRLKTKNKNKLKSSQSTDSQEFDNVQHRRNFVDSTAAAATAAAAVVKTDEKIHNPSTLSQDFENLQIDTNFVNISNSDKLSSSSILPSSSSRFKPSPPSTAPLPLKFPHRHDHHGLFIASNRSAPSLPHRNVFGAAESASHRRLQHIACSSAAAAGADIAIGSTGTVHSDSSTATGNMESNVIFRPIRKERPQSMIIDSKKGVALKNKRIQLRHHQRIKNFSSTESMTTSSSGGSMESLRSSTSEGNRSTTSFESRHSTSLSSHSSDSGSRALYPLRTQALIHSKLHILSPISDKSSLEHNSELFEAANNRVSGGKVDSGQAASVAEHPKSAKKLFLQNKALLLLGSKCLFRLIHCVVSNKRSILQVKRFKAQIVEFHCNQEMVQNQKHFFKDLVVAVVVKKSQEIIRDLVYPMTLVIYHLICQNWDVENNF